MSSIEKITDDRCNEDDHVIVGGLRIMSAVDLRTRNEAVSSQRTLCICLCILFGARGLVRWKASNNQASEQGRWWVRVIAD